MCKHAAAVLYGVGSRLDDRPELLFRLRDVDAEDLVVGDMALPDAAAGDDVLAGDLADIFGIDLDPADSGAAAARQKTTGRRRPRRGRPRRTGAPPSGFQPTAAGWRSCAAGADSRSPSSPACSAYPRRRCTAGKRPAGRSPSEPVRRTPCRCCTGKSRNARLSDPARSWPERRGRRAVRPPKPSSHHPGSSLRIRRSPPNPHLSSEPPTRSVNPTHSGNMIQNDVPTLATGKEKDAHAMRAPATRKKRRGGTRADVRLLPKCMKCKREIGPGEAYEVTENAHGHLTAWHAVRLYFDECAAAIPNTLQRMGFCIEPSLPKGTPDTEWLAHAGQRGCVVITQDARIAQNPIEKQALIDNDVKCFILPSSSKNAWDLVRGFVTMWEKVRVESSFSGPFIWKFNDDSHPVRWERLHPEDPGYAPFDLSRTPVGHLLNLFADIVHMHDKGWFTATFVEGLHNNIRRELEARISRDRSKAIESSSEWQPMVSQSIRSKSRDECHDTELEKPLDISKKNQLMVSMDNETGVYQWIIPAHVAGDNLSAPEEVTNDNAFAFQAGPTGFHRSGFGLRITPKKHRGRTHKTNGDILSKLSQEFDALGRHLEAAVDQWRRARTPRADPGYEVVGASDLYDALRMRCIWIQEHIQTVHHLHGSFWRDFKQELALEMRPIHAALARGHQVDNTELYRLAERVIKPLHHAIKRTRFASQRPNANVWNATFDRETVLDYLQEAMARGETPPLSAGFVMVGIHGGEPCIVRMLPEVDADGKTRRIAVSSSRAISGRVQIMGKVHAAATSAVNLNDREGE